MAKKTFLSAALENLEQAEPITAPDGEEGAAVAAETPSALSEEDLAVVEQAQGEEAEAAAEVAELETAVEELSEELSTAEADAERVEEVAEHLETAAENGGATPEAIAAIEVATEGLLQKYDLTLKHTLPALESFNNMRTRAQQTKYAAESFADKAKEMGKKVWDGILAMINWLRNLFARYLTVAGRLEARAQSIKAATKYAKGAKKQTVSAGGFLSTAKALAIDGKLPTNIVAEVTATVEAAYKVTLTAASVNSLIDKASDVAKDAKSEDKKAAVEKGVEEMRKQYTTFFEKSAAALGASAGNVVGDTKAFDLPDTKAEVYATKVLPGNKIIWGYREVEGGLSKFGIAKAPQEFKQQDVTTLSPEEIVKMADAAITAASLRKGISAVEAGIRKMAASVGSEGVTAAEGMKDTFKSAIWGVREALAQAGGFHRPAVQIALATASAGLDLAQASLKVYGVDEDLKKSDEKSAKDAAEAKKKEEAEKK